MSSSPRPHAPARHVPAPYATAPTAPRRRPFLAAASGLLIGTLALSACSGTAASPEETLTPSEPGTTPGAPPESGPPANPAQPGADGGGGPVGSPVNPPLPGSPIPGTPTVPGAPPGASSAVAPPALPPSETCVIPDASASVLRRLSKLEYQLTLKELFQLGAAPDVSLVPEDSDFKGFRTLAELQMVTTEHLRGYQSVAERLAQDVLSDEERRLAIIGCDLETAGCLETFVTNFGKLAYRRSLDAEEVAAYVALGASLDEAPEEQFVTIVSAMLSAANFLFRVEIGDQPQSSDLSTLDGEELASRLSFTLIGRGPSKELLDKGSRGELSTPEGLLAEAKALLADERAQEFYDAFFQQWLGFEQLRAPKQPDESWNDALMVSMQEETQTFLRSYAWTQGANFLDSFTANHSFMRADLAEFYRLPPPAENGYVEFPEDHDRAYSGLFTHAALLAAKRDGDRIAHRGAWVQSTFFCIDLELPTALLDSISDELAGMTFNEIFERRNTDDACAGCHALIDPIGVGLAAYDEAGRFQSDINLDEFSVAPRLPQADAPFETAGELAALLRNEAAVAQCLTRKMFLYTGGREASVADGCSLAQASARFENDRYRFASVLEGLVASPDFRLRRAPAQAAQGEN